jgi:hypothetical protein
MASANKDSLELTQVLLAAPGIDVNIRNNVSLVYKSVHSYIMFMSSILKLMIDRLLCINEFGK